MEFDSCWRNSDPWWKWRIAWYRAGQGFTLDLWTLRVGPLSIYFWRPVRNEFQ